MFYLVCNSIVNNIVLTHNWENMQKEINVHHIPLPNKKGTVSTWWYLTYLFPLGFIWYISYNISTGYVFALPLTSTAVGVIIFLVHLFVKNSIHYANKKTLKKSIEENTKFRKIWSSFIFFVGLVMQALLIIMQMGFLGIIGNQLLITASPFVTTILITSVSVYIAIRSNAD
jgi:drug/metabolite transporter (DMT)-like permease